MVNISKLSIIKCLELLLVLILVVLHYKSDERWELHVRFLTEGTIGGYLIILIGLFAAGLMSTSVNRRVDLFYSVLGCALFLIVGALTIHAFSGFSGPSHSFGIAKGVLSIVEGVLFLLDAVLTYRGDN